MSPDRIEPFWGYDVASKGPARELDAEKLAAEKGQAPGSTGYRWLHLNARDDASREWLADPENNIHPIAREALLADETRPRVAVLEGQLLLILRGVNLNPGADPEDMVSLRVLVEKNRVITVQRRRLLAIQDLRALVDTATPPRTRGEWLVHLVQRLLDRMYDPLHTLEDEFDALELKVLENPTLQLRRELGEVRRVAISLRRYLAPQRDALQRLCAEKEAPLSETDRLRMREAADRTIRFIEDLEADRDRATVTQEELAARTAEAMNRTSYMLTLVAGLFLPLGFLTGLMGINVGGMPGTESPHGFWVVTGICGVLALLQYWFFRSRRML